jgi:transcriptional regulator with XRE-family HTH domain
MANDRLRDALLNKGLTPAEAAEKIDVDPKTVERWIAQGRTPYARHRHALAALVQESERYLWPDAISAEAAEAVSGSEIVRVYAHRSQVPPDLWDRLLQNVTTYIDMLVYVGMFLTEKPDLPALLRQKAAEGARVRLIFGDRDAPAVRQRSLDEGIGEHTIAAKINHTLAFFRPLADAPGVQIRTHATVLYNSIYRFDDQMIVNPHVYGKVAAHAPALHLRRLSAGDLFTTYADSFTSVWEGATPYVW